MEKKIFHQILSYNSFHTCKELTNQGVPDVLENLSLNIGKMTGLPVSVIKISYYLYLHVQEHHWSQKRVYNFNCLSTGFTAQSTH